MDIKQLITTMLLVALMMLGYFYFVGNQNKGGGEKSKVTLVEGMPETKSKLPEENFELGGAAESDPYMMGVVVTNRAAAVEKVALNVKNYKSSTNHQEPMTLLEAHAKAIRPFATMKVWIDKVEYKAEEKKWVEWTYDLRNETWQWKKKDKTEARLTLALLDNAQKPLVEIEKIYRLDPKTYDVHVEHVVHNQTGQGGSEKRDLKVKIDQLGPIALPNDSRAQDMRNYQGVTYQPTNKVLITDKKTYLEPAVEKEGGQDLGSYSGDDPLVWTAAANRFFTVIVRPEGGPGAKVDELQTGKKFTAVNYISSTKVALAGSYKEADKDKYILGIEMQGADVTVPAEGSYNMPMSVFMGPKDRRLLGGDTKPEVEPGYDYYQFQYGKVIHYSQGGLCGPCTFEPVANSILWLLDIIHKVVFNNYGVAIIILVIVVRLLLHPLTRYSQINMTTMQKKMAKIQPELNALKKKYEKDKAKQQQEMMALYKKYNVNPAGGVLGCLPMFIQMPIWIALYAGLAVDIDLRQASFIPGWINDLSNPDTILPRPVPPIGQPLFHLPLMGDIYGLNLLPLLLAVVFFIQMRIQMKNMPKAADDQQAQTQKYSQWMIMIFPIFLYNAPSGLNLYIFASTIGGIFDTWLVKRHLKKRELLEAQAEGA